MPDVNISYKGSQIASMEGSGVKTLLTSGKYCEDDIFVSYNKTGNTTAEGDSSVSVNDAESGNICSLIQYGVCEQDAQTNAISCNNGTLSVSSGEIVTTAANREAIALGSQTATVENLYFVGNIRDEQELVTGTVIRKNAACIYDGTQPVGDRYISSTGAKDNGAIIIYPLETEHTGDSIVSFTETVKQDVNSLEASIEPIQDLHGYSNPWPAGGGKNKFNANGMDIVAGKYINSSGVETSNSNANYDKTFIPVTPSTAYTWTGDKLGGTNISGKAYFYDANKAFLSRSNDLNANVNTFSTPADCYYIQLQFGGTAPYINDFGSWQVEQGSTSTAWSPYSNICPITGRTGLSVYNDPKYGGTIEFNQKFPTKTLSYVGTNYTITSNNDGKFTVNATATASQSTSVNHTSINANVFTAGHVYAWIGNSDKIKVDLKAYAKNTDTIFKATTASYNNIVFLFDNLTAGTYEVFPQLFDLTEMFGQQKAEEVLSAEQSSTGSGVAWFRNLFYKTYYPVNAGETTCVSAVNGDLYWKKDIDWTTPAGTVYGWTLDVVSGGMDDYTRFYELDGDSDVLFGSYGTTQATEFFPYWFSFYIDAETSSDYSSWRFSHGIMSTSPYPGIFRVNRNSATRIQFVAGATTQVNNLTSLKSWLQAQKDAGTPLQIVVKLATPLTYQLTPQEVETLVGANNIFSPDATSIKVAVSNPVIEYVAPQPLTLAEGSNTVSATNLSVSSVPLELNYISKAAQPTSVAKKDVNFIDYDGTLLYSYTASEFANLSALPANPSHEGLVAQGWNWSLADAKTYVASYGKLWIGQMYITESGDTEIDIELHAPRLSPYLGLAVNGAVEVDWGDGTAKSTVTGTDTDLTTQIMTPHVYATDGSYTIKIHAVSGSFSLCGSAWNSVLSGNFSSNSNNVYSNTVQRVRIGSSMPSIYSAFSGCYSLTSITIPSGVTSISGNAFQSCYSLASITIPSGVTSIDSSAFSNCSSLTSITIPSGVTSIGNSAFYYCFSLALIPIPSGVTSISYRIFYYCYSLTSIMIPSEVTSIGSNAFDHCFSLASITIPSGVTSISGSAFYYCSGLGLIRFERTTPPSVSSSNAWTNIPTDCIILIPYDSDSYIGATNYPSSSTYSYVGYMTSVSGESLPSETSSEGYILDWYATKEEAASGTGTPLTQGNGNEIYCDYTQIASGGSN